jgi:hypothetical protein
MSLRKKIREDLKTWKIKNKKEAKKRLKFLEESAILDLEMCNTKTERQICETVNRIEIEEFKKLWNI